MRTKELVKQRVLADKRELADAHCHLHMLSAAQITTAIAYGVSTMITNGVDTASNIRSLELADNKHVFAALGVDPEHALTMSDAEIDFNIRIIKSNASALVAIGEIGLDYAKAKEAAAIARQREVFGRFLDLAVELGMPASIHSRRAIDDVLAMTKERGVTRAHLHFFEGTAQHAREAVRRGYTLSVPPMHSAQRAEAIRNIDMRYLMAESDSPAAGKTPEEVENSVRLIANVRSMRFDEVAEIVVENTKRFFNTRIAGTRTLQRR